MDKGCDSLLYLLPASLRSSPPADLATTFAFLLHAHLPFTPLPQFLLVCPQKRGYSFNQQGVQTTWNYGRVIFYLEKWSSPVLAPSIGRTLSPVSYTHLTLPTNREV